jgi:hypothetical protein
MEASRGGRSSSDGRSGWIGCPAARARARSIDRFRWWFSVGPRESPAGERGKGRQNFLRFGLGIREEEYKF